MQQLVNAPQLADCYWKWNAVGDIPFFLVCGVELAQKISIVDASISIVNEMFQSESMRIWKIHVMKLDAIFG